MREFGDDENRRRKKEDLPFFNHANERVGDAQGVHDIKHLLVHLTQTLKSQ
jgi:hypothetical protein